MLMVNYIIFQYKKLVKIIFNNLGNLTKCNFYANETEC